jgi:hypothetical protein
MSVAVVVVVLVWVRELGRALWGLGGGRALLLLSGLLLRWVGVGGGGAAVTDKVSKSPVDGLEQKRGRRKPGCRVSYSLWGAPWGSGWVKGTYGCLRRGISHGDVVGFRGADAIDCLWMDVWVLHARDGLWRYLFRHVCGAQWQFQVSLARCLPAPNSRCEWRLKLQGVKVPHSAPLQTRSHGMSRLKLERTPVALPFRSFAARRSEIPSSFPISSPENYGLGLAQTF